MAEDQSDQGLNKLTETMRENSKSTSEIASDIKKTAESQHQTEAHTRNARRHLLEIKKMQKVMNDFQARTLYGFQSFQDMIDSQSLQGLEETQENKSIFEEIRDALRALPKDTAKATKEETDSGGGLLGGLTSKLGGIGMAAAGIGLGIAAIFYTVPQLIKTFEDMDVKKIKGNITELVSINKAVEEEGGNLLLDGGTLALAMTGIGIGLAALGIGSGVAGGVDKFLDDGWAEKIKHNVLTLLSIDDAAGGNLEFFKDSGTFMLAMGGLGLGLVAFGIGQGIAGGADKFAEEGWSERIKHNVGVLLSISELNTGDADEVMGTLSKIGGGLVGFGVGSFFAKASGDGQGEQIKNEVAALLSITNDPNAGVENAIQVKETLDHLGSGLVDFGVGSFFAKAVGEGSGEKIRQEVASLLSIADDPNASYEDITRATAALGALGVGLTAFGTGGFVQSLAGAASAVLDFFSGNKSPIEQAKDLGQNADTIVKGTEALDGFVTSLNSFEDVGNFSFDAEEFATQLAIATETLEAALIGGEIGGGFFTGPEFEFKGLKQYQDDIDDLADALIRLQQGFGGALDAMSGQNSLLRLENSGAQNTTAIQSADNSVRRGGDNITILQNNSNSAGSAATAAVSR